uniref:response regulator n=1 Tax=Flexistipes sinusarabici TaxID=2352 RepID=UPI0023555643
MRILLVDDDVYTLDILTTLLEKTIQSDVLSVSTKKEAVEALERENFLFIITDIKLEDGSGYEVLEKAKRKNVLTPVI